MVIQVVADDSGNTPGQDIYVLAGYLATTTRWVQFTREWEACIKEAPGAQFVKYTQARSLKGQFSNKKGWTDESRDARVERLCRLVCEAAIGRVHVAMRHEHFAQYIQSVEVPVRSALSDKPYLLMSGRLVSAAVAHLSIRGLSEPCEFIFDTQPGDDVILRALWPSIVRTAESAPPALLVHGVKPTIVNPPKLHRRLSSFRFKQPTYWPV